VPLPGARTYVLDAHLQPVAIGVPGELYVGGSGVSTGYLNRADLTAQSFVADPFVPGERIYKSGDSVRWLSNGELEYLGRINQQVKSLGVHIERGETESILGNHPAVRPRVVAVRNVNDDPRLAAS
jgi:non-ribosomal peptide synthetase component F